MKWLKYQFLIFLLNHQYRRKLAAVQRDRFNNCKYGLISKQRDIVHEWAAKERKRIHQSVYGV